MRTKCLRVTVRTIVTTAHYSLQAESSVNILHPSLSSSCLHCHTQQSLRESLEVKALAVMVTLSLDTATQGQRHPIRTHSQLIFGIME